ncbi:MAG: hypothetical protein J5I47_03470 [Vicingus serpentipes]|nr:hypothetical protein [Vicingus serpentipes]
MTKAIAILGVLVGLANVSFGQWIDLGNVINTSDYVQVMDKIYLPYEYNDNNYIRPKTPSGFTYFDQGGVGIGHQGQYSGFKLHVNGMTNLNGDVGIGIGNTAPSAKLHVNGSVRINDNPILLRSGSDDNHGLGFFSNHDNATIDGPVLYGYSGGALGSNQSGVRKHALIWKRNGNILIGTNDNPLDDVRLWVETASDYTGKVGVLSKSNYSTPWGYGFLSAFPSSQFKAFVATDLSTNKEVFVVHGNGHVFAQEITVQLAPFPDYVFAKDYELMTISELGDYINENNHLPNMPSAIEVEKNGMGVGELQVKLVEKVEELTLYIIELENRLAKLEREKK